MVALLCKECKVKFSPFQTGRGSKNKIGYSPYCILKGVDKTILVVLENKLVDQKRNNRPGDFHRQNEFQPSVKVDAYLFVQR
jgi:hypothetical protein